MNTLEKLAQLSTHGNIDAWRDLVTQFGANLGYQHASLAIFPCHDTPIESESAFLHTTLPAAFLKKYDLEKMGECDPIVTHCMARNTPLIWSAGNFTSSKQLQLYDEVCLYGARSGIALPHHGPNGEFGILNFASESDLNEKGRQEAMKNIPELSSFRDSIMEVFSGFMRQSTAMPRENIELTARELECIKWCASGKSSWDIAQLMNCTEATVNYHFTNIRRKFGASSRRMAIIKAIRMGFISV